MAEGDAGALPPRLPSPGTAPGPAKRRLSRSGDFERVYRQGRSRANRHLVLYAFPRDEAAAGSGPRLGLSVSRRVGGAVARNRIKRLVREAFRARAERLPDANDYVVVARPESAALAEREGLAGVAAALDDLLGDPGRKP